MYSIAGRRNSVQVFVPTTLGRHLGYLPVLLPLLAAALIVRKAFSDNPAEKRKPYDPESELFTPYGP